MQMRVDAAAPGRRTVARPRVPPGVALLGFGLLAVYAALPASRVPDLAFTHWIQRAAPGPDLAASIFTLLCNAEVVIPATVLVAVVLYLTRRPGWAETAWLAAGLAAGSVLAVVLKHVIAHPGPSGALLRPGVAFGIRATTPFSFPSGHTLRTTMIAGAALRRLPWLAAALVIAMMAALVYVGAHWLSDVLGGLCLGWTLLGALEAVRTARSRNCLPG
jgi:membrane-associated phospholipid phosphatase